MKAIQNGDGHVGLTARSYPVATNASIKRGQVVKLSGGAAISAIAAETNPLLGIAAETHGGTADVLNPRNNGTELLVYDNPTLIFECPAPVFTASGGSATTVTAATSAVACTTADVFNNGRLKLKKKGTGSGNTDCVGTVKTVTDFSSATGTATFTVASGATAAGGDEYYLFPPIGSAAGMALDAVNFSRLVLTASGCTKIKVVGWDLERNMLRLMAVEHALAVEA